MNGRTYKNVKTLFMFAEVNDGLKLGYLYGDEYDIYILVDGEYRRLVSTYVQYEGEQQ